MKKKTIAILLTAILLISVTACGNTSAEGSGSQAGTTEQFGDLESSPEESAGDSLEETSGGIAEESEEASGGEQFTGDVVSVAENGESFAYMMDDDWYEPSQDEFHNMWEDIGEAILGLETYAQDTYEKLQEWDKGDEVMNNIVRRWEEESYEGQGSYTWEQFEHDIYNEYNMPMPNGQKCKIGDSYWVYSGYMGEDVTEQSKWVVDDWYDRYVSGWTAEILEELAERADVDTYSDEFCIIFRLVGHSTVSIDQVGFILSEDEILAEYSDIKEQFVEDSVSESQDGRSFTYMMDDGWWEPWYWDFERLAYNISKTALDHGISNIIQRWEEESYEGQGSYTWKQFKHDIYAEYNMPMPSGQDCKIGDSYSYHRRNGDYYEGEECEWVVDNWYDRYVCGTEAEYFEELAKQIGIDTSSDEFCGIFRRFLNTCISAAASDLLERKEGDVSSWQANEKEILTEFGIEQPAP